jgi:hypothetical protein
MISERYNIVEVFRTGLDVLNFSSKFGIIAKTQKVKYNIIITIEQPKIMYIIYHNNIYITRDQYIT